MGIMEEDIVSFETAKLAFEKGYLELARYMYDEYGNLESALDHTGEVFFDADNLRSADDNGYKMVLAPELHVLQKWLREKKDEIIIPYFDVVTEKYFYFLFRKGATYKMSNERQFDTYEQALEDGLIKALKLIQ